MKYAMIVHPFWNYIDAENELEMYKEAVKNYDVVYAYLPVMSDYIRREMFNVVLSRGLLRFILSLRGKTDIPESIPRILNYSIYSMSSDMYRFEYAKHVSRKLLISIAKFLRLSAREDRSRLRKVVRGNSIDKLTSYLISSNPDIITDEFLKLLFYADHHNCIHRNEYIERLLKIDNITPLYYGATSTVDAIGGLEGFPTIDISKIEQIDIFGTYYNICVKDLMGDLNFYKSMKIRRIKRWSSYSTKRHSFIQDNKDKYFGIYHDDEGVFYRNGIPCIDKEGDLNVK